MLQVLWISDGVAKRCAPEDVESLLARDDGFVWVDVPEFDDDAAGLLAREFRMHPMALRDCRERSHVAKIRASQDAVFLIIHAPEPGDAGHVHLVELDMFVGLRFLVTTHGPLGEGVPLEVATREVQAVAGRMEPGRLAPRTPADLAHAIISAVVGRLEQFVSALADHVAALERRVMRGEMRDPERSLEELFLLRHELLSVRTMAAGGHEVMVRMAGLSRFLPEDARALVDDLVDRYRRVGSICSGEMDFLQGALDLYQSRTATKMNIAMERLALIAAVMMPVTAVAGIYGMNIIVSDASRPVHIAGVLGVMGLVTALMLRWARRHGWW